MVATQINISSSVPGLEYGTVDNSDHIEMIHFHFHDSYTLIRVKAGSGVFDFTQKRIEVRTGDLLLIPPGVTHRSGRRRQESHLVIQTLLVPAVYFQDQDLDHEFFPNSKAALYIGRERNELRKQMGLIFERVIHEKSGRRRQAFDQLIACIGKKKKASEKEYPPTVEILVQYLNENRFKHPSLNDLCKVTGKSKSQVIRLFKSHVGLTPHEYLINLRINRAKEMISGGTAIADAAVKVGFIDQSHLYKYFKRSFYLSPGRYRTLYMQQF